jgi:hypothetical protein
MTYTYRQAREALHVDQKMLVDWLRRHYAQQKKTFNPNRKKGKLDLQELETDDLDGRVRYLPDALVEQLRKLTAASSMGRRAR